MKKLISAVLVGVFALSFVAGIALTNAQADDTVPLCYTDCRGELLYWCCPVQCVKVQPNCKGPNCKCEWVFDCDPVGPCPE